MHAAQRPQSQSSNVALRSQLLSTDIGNIDVTKEIPINKHQHQPEQQQQQPNYYPHQYQQQYGLPQQPVYAQNPYPQNSRQGAPPPQGQFYPNQPPLWKPNPVQQQQQQQQQQQPQPRSRRSSVVSNHSTFNSFLKFGKQKKGFSRGGGDEDDDDYGKDMMDPTQLNSMSFDDLTTMRDRGRYGSQSTYDTTPIIPTLASAATKPQGNVSSIQYRKQMTAIKKQAYTNAGKSINDPRSMSLQTGSNPYMSVNDPRAVPVTGQGPLNSPRANSLAGPPPQQFQPRNNSFTNNPQFNQQGPRAQSLTSNSFQQQQRGSVPFGYGPAPPHMRPNQGQYPPPMGNPHRLSASGPSPLSFQQRAPYSPQPHAQRQSQVLQPSQSTLTQNNEVEDTTHHYLADNSQLDENMDVSGQSFSDVSTSRDHPIIESTPSPETLRKEAQHSDISPSKLPRSKALPHLSLLKMRDDDEDEEDRQDEAVILEAHTVREVNNRTSIDFVPSILEPLDESKPYQTSATPPLPDVNGSPYNSANSSPFKRLNSNKTHFKNAVSISSMSEYSTVSDNREFDDGNHRKLYQLADKSNTNNEIFVTASQFSLMGQENESTFRPDDDIDYTYSKTPKIADDYEDEKTPVIAQQSPTFETKSHRTSSGSLKDALKSPKFLRIWSRKKSVETVTPQQNSPISEEATLKYAISSSEGIKAANSQTGTEKSSDFSPATSTTPSSPKSSSLGGSFVPQKLSTKSLNLTVDQLGIMEDKTTLIRELDLVSRELAASIKRELKLEEKLQGKSTSPYIVNPEDQLKSNALEISRLTQLLNEERKKRYIAEEHVLLQENGVQPSALELNFENENLKTELSSRDELINKQSSHIESLRSEIPISKSKIDQLTKSNYELQEVNSELKNEVEVLKDDRKKLTILTQKFKILRAEKSQLEKQVLNSTEGQIKLNKTDSPNSLSPNNTLAIKNQRSFFSGKSPNSSYDDLRSPASPFNAKRLTSFSLINVSSSGDD